MIWLLFNLYVENRTPPGVSLVVFCFDVCPVSLERRRATVNDASSGFDVPPPLVGVVPAFLQYRSYF
jgi:hypothetical protein